jgi:hypothetical protein
MNKALGIAKTAEGSEWKSKEFTQEGWWKSMTDRARQGVVMPQGLIVGIILFLLAQTVTGIYWAGKLDTTMSFMSQSIQTQKESSESQVKRLESELKEEKDKNSLQEKSIQMLQVKMEVLEGRRK